MLKSERWKGITKHGRERRVLQSGASTIRLGQGVQAKMNVLSDTKDCRLG